MRADKTNQEFLVAFEHPEPRFYTRIPNIVDDDKRLSVHDFRLYCHLRRVAGENGVCFQTTRTLAEVTNMSIGAIVKSKRNLLKLGYIRIERQLWKGQICDQVTIANIWGENLAKYHNKSAQNEAGVHQVNGRCSPGELKNEPLKEKPRSPIGREALPQLNSSDNNHPSPISFQGWRDRLNQAQDGTRSKVGVLITAFKTLHPQAPAEDFDELGGRIAAIAKGANNDWGYVLKIIWETSCVNIAGSHLNYIQGASRHRKGNGGGRKPRMAERPASDFTGEW
jgi:hypothetical protein